MTEYFKEIEDTRQQGKIKYELLEVIAAIGMVKSKRLIDGLATEECRYFITIKCVQQKIKEKTI